MDAEVIELKAPANLVIGPERRLFLVPSGHERVIGDVVREGDYIAEAPFSDPAHEPRPAALWKLAEPQQLGRGCGEFFAVVRAVEVLAR